MRKALDPSTVPVGGHWTYICPEDGHKIECPSFDRTFNLVKAYRRLNGFPIGLEIMSQIEDNICGNAAPGTCYEFQEPSLAQKAVNLSLALARAVRNGFKAVDAAEYERRLSVCKDCTFFGGLSGPIKVLCRKCGCSHFKAHLASENCPDNRW